MDVCLLRQDGEMVLHRHMPAGPDPFRKAIAPYREDRVVCGAGIFTCDWLADLCARAGISFVLGHALDMQAIHGGKATNDTSDSQQIAALLRGGLLPQAAVSPAAMRATRDLRRRRRSRMRNRAERLPQVQPTNSQGYVPEVAKQIAYTANRDGVAERLSEPAGQKRIAVDRALMGHEDDLLWDLEWAMVTTAKPHEAHPLSLRQTGPGRGQMLRLVLLYAIHAVARFPRVQDCVAYGHLGPCAKASAGKR
jgi:hypothetical protein